MSTEETVEIKRSKEPMIVPADLQAIINDQAKPVPVEEEPHEENMLIELLENKDILVKGIILSEILGKPKSKR
ncbi:MAG: hypothetical protein WCY62_09010 [Clostridia bacterium]|jgi:hypothetical protein